jgi:HlyD family secretion protein
MKPQRAVILVVALIGVGIAFALALAPRQPETRTLSGYVEAEPLYPAAAASGRITKLNVQRGDRVQAGQVLFEIDSREAKARQSEAEAAAAAAAALAADARTGARPTELGVIEAQLASARTGLAEAERSFTRTRTLVEAEAAPRAQLDAAVAARDAARANVRAFEQQLATARLGARKAQAQAAADQARQAEAALTAARARLTDLAPTAPADGQVEEVYFQAGEWAPANQPVLSLIPDGRIRLRFFIPQDELSHYPPGREVRFSCDGCPDNLKARVSYVSPRPEFTPPVIYSREARERMSFLAEAEIAPGVRLAPGQPVDVERLAP